MIGSRGIFTVAVMLAMLAGAHAQDVIPRGRLPDDVRPQHYLLQLDVDPRQERFAGTVEIRVEVRRPVSTIWLHGQGLAVSEASVETVGRTLAARYEEVDTQTGISRLTLDGTLPAGVATLRLAWTTGFRPGGEALYRTRAGDEWYAFTQFQPIDARRAFPGFDEPRFKTPFEMSVFARASDRVVTNAPLAGTTPRPDDRVLHAFRPTLPLPTYLVALAVGPLDVVEATLPPNAVRGVAVPLRGVATRGKGAQLAYALRHTPPMVDRLEAYFGIPYPYPKLDLIASPEQGGAMENAGAIIYSDTLLLLDESAPPAQQRSFFEVHAHELAHHWFGDLVTPEWWDDIWLNESFASWMGVKIAEELRPDLRVAELAVAGVTYAMDVDSKRAGRPIRQPVTDNLQITDTFDSITYLKGGGVLSMVESWLGGEAFRDGVRLHLRRHEHGSATSDQFFAALAESARQPVVVEAFRSFVDQPGVPLVSLEATASGDWRATQQRYRPVGSRLESGQLWKMPLCVRGGAGDPSTTPSCSLLAGATDTVRLASASNPVMPNANGAGYYRFSLAEPELAQLVAVAAKLPAPEAIMLADSVAAAFRAGQLSFANLLAAARELAASPSRPAATLLGGEIVDIRDRWADEAARSALSGVVRELYGPRLNSLGLDPRRGGYAGAPSEERLLRHSLASLVALHGGDPALRARLAAAARASLDDSAALDPEFRALAWSVGVQDLGPTFAASLEKVMLASQDSLLRLHAARALGAADDPATSARALELALDERVRTNEMYGLLMGPFEGPATRTAAWAWFDANIDAVMRRLPAFAQGYALGLVEPFCDASQRSRIAAVLEPRAQKLAGGGLQLQRALEDIDLCVARREAFGPSVAAALAGR
jgi:aminopeptidase N